MWKPSSSCLCTLQGQDIVPGLVTTSFFNLWILFNMLLKSSNPPGNETSCDVVTTSFCTSQRRRSYVSNETPNDVSVELRQDVSVVPLHDVLLERRYDVSRGGLNDVSSVRVHDVSNKAQMKHPTTSQWYVTKTSQRYKSTTSH